VKSRQLSCDLLGGSASNPYTKNWHYIWTYWGMVWYSRV